jgi:uncharacterized protein DUF6584
MMASLTDRVAADIASGRLWKARDRLAGALRMEPTDQEILDQLGGVYYRMGDLPAAGRLWFLTTRTGPESASAIAAFFERYGHEPADIVGALPIRAPIDAYPAEVQGRLRSLQNQLKKEGNLWQPRVGGLAQVQRRGSRLGGSLTVGIVILLLLVLVLVLFIGLFSILDFVFRALGGR